MPLINCPDCHKRMSDLATACPNCGSVITEPVLRKQREQEATVQKLTAVIFCGFVLIFLMFVVSTSFASRSPSTASNNGQIAVETSDTPSSRGSIASAYEESMRKQNVANKDYPNSHGINVKHEHEKMLKILQEIERH